MSKRVRNEHLIALREKRTLTQANMGDILKMSQANYAKYENGTIPVPPVRHRQKIATVLAGDEVVLWPSCVPGQ